MRNAEHDSGDRCFKPGCTMCCKHTKAALHDDPKWNRAARGDADDDDIDHKKKRELARQRKAARRAKDHSHS